MNYDKDSFLAGIAVGRQMKGWATSSVLPEPVDDTKNIIQNGWTGHVKINDILIEGTGTKSVVYNLLGGTNDYLTAGNNFLEAILTKLKYSNYRAPLFAQQKRYWGRAQTAVDNDAYQSFERGTAGSVEYTSFNVPVSPKKRTVLWYYYGSVWQSSQNIRDIRFQTTKSNTFYTLRELVLSGLIEPVVIMQTGGADSSTTQYYPLFFNLYLGFAGGNASYANGQIIFTLKGGVGINKVMVNLQNTTTPYSNTSQDGMGFIWYDQTQLKIEQV